VITPSLVDTTVPPPEYVVDDCALATVIATKRRYFLTL